MRTHDLVIVGAGSGNAIVDHRFSHLDVAVVDEGLFGGTCLNRGCIPSKTLVHVADVADGVREAGSLGVDATLRDLRWADVRTRVFGRLDREAAEGEKGRRESPYVHVYKGHARFTEERTLLVGAGENAVRIRGEQVVVAVGSRPTVPGPVAESGLPYETSDTVMRRNAPPRHLAVLGAATSRPSSRTSSTPRAAASPSSSRRTPCSPPRTRPSPPLTPRSPQAATTCARARR